LRANGAAKAEHYQVFVMLTSVGATKGKLADGRTAAIASVGCLLQGFGPEPLFCPRAVSAATRALRRLVDAFHPRRALSGLGVLFSGILRLQFGGGAGDQRMMHGNLDQNFVC
jgi:hypothetical protein